MNPKPDLHQAALDYHEFPVPGKLSVTPTKQLSNQNDLSLAYSPGVAVASQAIAADPAAAVRFTGRGNLVGVVTNGTAVLGLGAIGPLASKPVMEGKAALFKKFAGIDVFDIEIAQNDPERLVEVIAALEPTFGAINLEDIKAPECFMVERMLRERMKIPVFHDDQHGTAIIVAAAVLNGLHVVGKSIGQVKLVVSGAGAAALACVELLVELGLPRSQCLADGSRRRGLPGPHRTHGSAQAGFCTTHQGTAPERGHRRRGRVSGALGRRRAEAGHGSRHGRATLDSGARQSDAGDSAERSSGSPERCGHRHGPK